MSLSKPTIPPQVDKRCRGANAVSCLYCVLSSDSAPNRAFRVSLVIITNLKVHPPWPNIKYEKVLDNMSLNYLRLG